MKRPRRFVRTAAIKKSARRDCAGRAWFIGECGENETQFQTAVRICSPVMETLVSAVMIWPLYSQPPKV